MPDKDYSATPLSKKLGAKPGAEVLVVFTSRRAELDRRLTQLKDTRRRELRSCALGRPDDGRSSRRAFPVCR
jgi:hypothetical protein